MILPTSLTKQEFDANSGVPFERIFHAEFLAHLQVLYVPNLRVDKIIPSRK
ncbi:MAG: hypothetical protein IPP60_13385 [Sphingobacteriales bacterium]|nr:hypothetical protein [Sphingobacteriales bacterium]